MGLGRPPVADDPDALEERVEAGLPVVEQLVQDGIEPLLGRGPKA
jgi:hypothetical protein